MKKFAIWLSAFLLTTNLAYSNFIKPDKIPSTVKEAFSSKFTNATSIKYKKERKDFEISFVEKGVKKSASFDESGNWLKTESELRISEIPREIRNSVASNFEGYTITDPVAVETPDLALFYEMNLKNGNLGYDVRFSPKGVILGKTELEDEDYDDEVN